MEIPFNRVGIVGVGLIGGSLGLALKKADPRIHVRGVGRDPVRLRIAWRMRAIDSFAVGFAGSLEDCDLVVLALPIEHILSALEGIGNSLAPGSVVTDVGSTKREICRLAWSRLSSEVEFIGGHPIAGREVAGVENSLASLFEGAPYVLCPKPDRHSDRLARLRSLVERIGAEPCIMSPEEHDRAIAWVSHLPQLLSTALANITDIEQIRISGSGFRDMVRLAGSSYSVWRGIFQTNSDKIDLALSAFVAQLEKMRGDLKDGPLSEAFERARELYERIQSKQGLP